MSAYNIEKVEVYYPNGVIEYVDTMKEAKQKAQAYMYDYIKTDPEIEDRHAKIVFEEDDCECILLVNGNTYDSISLSQQLMTEELWVESQARAKRSIKRLEDKMAESEAKLDHEEAVSIIVNCVDEGDQSDTISVPTGDSPYDYITEGE